MMYICMYACMGCLYVYAYRPGDQSDGEEGEYDAPDEAAIERHSEQEHASEASAHQKLLADERALHGAVLHNPSEHQFPVTHRTR